MNVKAQMILIENFKPACEQGKRNSSKIPIFDIPQCTLSCKRTPRSLCLYVIQEMEVKNQTLVVSVEMIEYFLIMEVS